MTGIPAATTGRHSGCRTRFGPDGDAVGHDRRRRRPTNPQNLQSLGGKVLRIGTEPPANPAVDPLATIYAYGFRNPQGISFRPSDGKPFLIEHGPELRRRDHAARRRRQRWLEPGGARQPGGLQRERPDDRLTKFAERAAAVVDVGLPDHRPVRRHVRQRRRLG